MTGRGERRRQEWKCGKRTEKTYLYARLLPSFSVLAVIS